MVKTGQPPRRPHQSDNNGNGNNPGTSPGLPPQQSSSHPLDASNAKQHHNNSNHEKPRRPKLRERTMSSGSTRGAFGTIPSEAGDPTPVTQVTLGRKQKQRKSKHQHQSQLPPSPPKQVVSNNNDTIATTTPENSMDFGADMDLSAIAAKAMADEENGLAPSDYGTGQQYNAPPRNQRYQQQQQQYSQQRPPMENPGATYGRPSLPSRHNKSNNSDDLMVSSSTVGEQDLPGYLSSERSMLLGTNYYRSNVTDSLISRSTTGAVASSINHKHAAVTEGNNESDDEITEGEMFEEDDDDYDDYDDHVEGRFEAFYRRYIYDDQSPEFSSLQQTFWAVVIGSIMGVFTALWGFFIEACVEFTWETVPTWLYEKGILTDMEGSLPMPHYMWICPAIFGGVLAYITAIQSKPIPGQNEWIESCHKVGVMEHDTILPCFFISTAGMASGLSLGPEMPLVLITGMMGSYLGVKFNQSVLSARVMNLTAASAAIGGFFGFPLAGALFVLELPHRMGLQYFEAFSPATVASIVAVLVNRMVTKNEVNGYYEYPFLGSSLPSHIFYIAIVYGIVGSVVGIAYADGCLFLKKWVHDWFHVHHDDHHDHEEEENEEHRPFMKTHHASKPKKKSCWRAVADCFTIPHEPTRAAVAGVLAGIIVGLMCMFVPHTLFWGEAQLQTLINRGKTPLPVFGEGDEPTALLTAYGYCLVDQEDARALAAGFSMSCAGVITVFKIIAVGLSLGTGIMGGHFWAPLCVAVSASHFFVDLCNVMSDWIGFGAIFSMYPCVAMICIMGSTHVVTFRAHTAIMLILTLTIKSFSTILDGGTAGDYSAIFPLLVVACYIPLTFTRNTVFYKTQTCRGDILAIPQVLCQPGKAGVTGMHYNDKDTESYGSGSGSESGISMSTSEDEMSDDGSKYEFEMENHSFPTQTAEFGSPGTSHGPDSLREVEVENDRQKAHRRGRSGFSAHQLNATEGDNRSDTGSMQNVKDIRVRDSSPAFSRGKSSPSEGAVIRDNSPALSRSKSSRSGSRTRSNSLSRPVLRKVHSIGKIEDNTYSKPLLEQGRAGAATRSIPRHRRTRSNTSSVGGKS